MLIAALSVFASGCATIDSSSRAPAPEIHPPASSPSARSFSDNVDVAGRLSVRYQGSQKEEALHGNFTWVQSAVKTTVTMLSPLGQTVAVIEVTPEGATLRQANQPVRSAPDVDALTAETLGWPLPVSGLRQWLQGFGVDASRKRFIANPQASDFTTRDGWRIRYANWQDEASPQSRPRRIDLSRNTAQAGDVSIRIVIDTWQEH